MVTSANLSDIQFYATQIPRCAPRQASGQRPLNENTARDFLLNEIDPLARTNTIEFDLIYKQEKRRKMSSI